MTGGNVVLKKSHDVSAKKARKCKYRRKEKGSILMILRLYSKMKEIYVEAEVEVIEIAADDIITESGCETGAGGPNETELI